MHSRAQTVIGSWAAHVSQHLIGPLERSPLLRPGCPACSRGTVPTPHLTQHGVQPVQVPSGPVQGAGVDAFCPVLRICAVPLAVDAQLRKAKQWRPEHVVTTCSRPLSCLHRLYHGAGLEFRSRDDKTVVTEHMRPVDLPLRRGSHRYEFPAGRLSLAHGIGLFGITCSATKQICGLIGHVLSLGLAP
jgi:hypothetical protein